MGVLFTFVPSLYRLKVVVVLSVPRNLQLTKTPLVALMATTPRSRYSICFEAANVEKQAISESSVATPARLMMLRKLVIIYCFLRLLFCVFLCAIYEFLFKISQLLLNKLL